MYYLMVQTVGFVGMALCIGSFQCKNSRNLILCQAVGNALYVIQFLLLGAYSGCVSTAIYIFGNILLSTPKGEKALWLGWKWLLSASLVAACIMTWENWFSLLPCVASIAAILTNWTRNGKIIRLGKLFCVGPGWGAYGLYVRSYSGALSEAIGMCSALISIYRYGLKGLDKVS